MVFLVKAGSSDSILTTTPSRPRGTASRLHVEVWTQDGGITTGKEKKEKRKKKQDVQCHSFHYKGFFVPNLVILYVILFECHQITDKHTASF